MSSALKNKTRALLVAARRDRVRGPLSEHEEEKDDISKEIDDYFQFTQSGDESYDDAVAWWAAIGRKRFPRLSLLARDTLVHQFHRSRRSGIAAILLQLTVRVYLIVRWKLQ
ncbi:Uncharacterized protein PBTT_07267 [Plasmodiophora brassicae]